jgi:Glycosyl hydrolase family 26
LSKKRGVVVLALLAVGLLAAQASSARAAVYWGATISGEPYGQTGSAPFNQSAWDLFERHAGKRVAVLNTSQAWSTFDAKEMDATRARGAIPMVTMGLGEGVTLGEIVAGGQDSAIRSWARAAKAWAHPFFLAPWWEMNGEWYPWGRDPDFVAAWRHFHDLVVAEGATNVTWAWVTNSLWFDPGSDPTPYYPGDAYVDWTGIDTYNWGRNPAQPDRWINPDQTITPTLNRVKEIAPGKPVVILENASSEFGGNKADWIAEMLGTYLPHHPEIKAYLWFNWNFQKHNGLRADWPIESSAPAQQAFRKGIQSSFYRSTPPALPNLTKVPLPPPLSGGDGPSSADISPSGEDAAAPQVAVAPDGNSTVVWSGQTGAAFSMYERRIAPDGTLGRINQLSAPGQDALSPQVAVAPDGTATVVWIRSDGSNFVVQERRVAPGGALEATKDLSVTGRDAAEPQVAIAPDGTATVVWKRFDGAHFQIKERRIGPGGALEEPSSHTLSETGRDAVGPQVAVAPDGTATVVWSRFDGTNSIVQESRIAPDDTPVAGVNDLSASGRSAIQPDVVVDPDGTATVIWVRSDGADTIVQERRIPGSGVPSATTNDLSAPGQDAAEPRLALGPEGAVTVVWERFDGSSFIVQDRRITPAGARGASAINLSASGRDASEPQVAVAPDGSATVIWSRFDGSHFIVARRGLAPDGTPMPITESLSAPGRSAGGAQLTAGALMTIWTRFDGANDIVQGTTDPSPAALLTPASHDFGSIQLGTGGSSAHLFKLFNSGNAPLSVSSVTVGGPDADQFGLTGTGSCTGAPLSSGSSCEFSAAFEPSSAGKQVAAIEVVSNAASSPDAAPLAGTAVATGSAVAPGSSRSPARPIRIDNTFKIGRPLLNRRKGTARLPVTVPAAGTLILAGSVVATLPVAGPGTVTMNVRARDRKSGLLNRNGIVALRLALTFVPTGGEPSTQKTTLRLRKRR